LGMGKVASEDSVRRCLKPVAPGGGAAPPASRAAGADAPGRVVLDQAAPGTSSREFAVPTTSLDQEMRSSTRLCHSSATGEACSCASPILIATARRTVKRVPSGI